MRRGTAPFSREQCDTYLSEDLSLEGKLEFRGSVLIEGNFDGEIYSSDGHLIIAPTALVRANINCVVVSNWGHIIGDVDTTARFELYDGAKLDGDVISPDVKIEPGSQLNGNLITTNKNSKR